MSAEPTAATPALACPTCNAQLERDPVFVTWCDACGWNLEPNKATKVDSRQRRREQRARRRGQALFEQLAKHPLERPRMSRAALLSVAIALVIHAVTLILFAAGVFVLVRGAPHTAAVILGAFLVLLALLLRPHVGRLRRDEIRLDRAQAPALFELTDAVSRHLGAQPVPVIVVDGRFNAAHGKVGLRRTPVLWLGLPLWDILTDRERLALLGHEFGHQVNGDLRRGFVVGTAVRTLVDWYRLLHPRFRWRQTFGLFAFAEQLGALVAVAVIRGMGMVVGLLLRIELDLLYTSSQQGEYYADALGAEVASASAAAACMERLHLARPCTLAIEHALRNGRDPWTAERDLARTLPPKELERLRRIDDLHGTSVDATHPPTGLRVALLHRNATDEAALHLSEQQSTRIAAELDRVRPRVTERLRTRVAARAR